MPVETGYQPDPEDETEVPSGPPPEEVAGLSGVAAEPTDASMSPDGPPTFKLRDREFRLRNPIPGMVVMKVNHAIKIANDPRTQTDPEKQMKAMDGLYEGLIALVVPEDQDAYEEFAVNAEPPIDISELTLSLNQMIKESSGRNPQ
jgi:hypothetical protein